MAKQVFTPPKNLQTLCKQLCLQNDFIYLQLRTLYPSLKIRREATRTLICIYAFHRFGHRKVCARMLLPLNLATTKTAVLTKCHRLAGKEFLSEVPLEDTPERYFELTQNTIQMLDYFLYGREEQKDNKNNA